MTEATADIATLTDQLLAQALHMPTFAASTLDKSVQFDAQLFAAASDLALAIEGMRRYVVEMTDPAASADERWQAGLNFEFSRDQFTRFTKELENRAWSYMWANGTLPSQRSEQQPVRRLPGDAVTEQQRRARVVKGWAFRNPTGEVAAAVEAYLDGGPVPAGYEKLDASVR